MTVGVVGDDVESLAGVVAETGVDVETAISDPVPGAAYHVAVGESAVLSLLRAGVDTPVLPVEAGDGLGSTPAEALADTISDVGSDPGRTDQVSTLSVSIGEESHRALMDVMVVSTEAAKISEYEVRTREGSGPDRETVTIDRVRADGIVAATPVGTTGYSSSAGGPVVARDIQGVSVVPVGPFRVEHPQWVLGLPVTLAVLREEVPVSLVVDDREIARVKRDTPVTLSSGPPLEVIRTAESRSIAAYY
ncbi:MAG: hypothetical protein ABEJ58_03075 [Halodesulfurarchaeum sp.]